MHQQQANIKAVVRVRPLLFPETRSCVVVNDEQNITITTNNTPHEQSFCFDHVAGPKCNQSQMMELIGKPITDQCLDGFNGTIFAYGQTGSGKTYTMNGGQWEQSHGLIPNIFQYLYHKISHQQNIQNTYSVRMSCYEIYNKNIIDLLDDSRGNLQIRQDSKRRFYVQNLSQKLCESATECLELVKMAMIHRQTSSTKMNQHSSRSHLILTLTITRRQILHIGDDNINIHGKQDTIKTRTSILNMVDLAGSERQTKTGAVGDRLKEAKCINQSLTELGRVIASIIKKEKHIPFRNSELTKLLKHSLGGNSITFVIANISPSVTDAAETLSTLLFADRVKQIRNTAKINEDEYTGSLNENATHYVRIIEELKAKIQNEKLKNEQLTAENAKLSAIISDTKHQEIPCSKIVNQESTTILKLKKKIKMLTFQALCTEHIAIQPLHRGGADTLNVDDSLHLDPWIVVSWKDDETPPDGTLSNGNLVVREDTPIETGYFDHFSTAQLIQLLQESGAEDECHSQSIRAEIKKRLRVSVHSIGRNEQPSFFKELRALIGSQWTNIKTLDPKGFVRSVFRGRNVGEMSTQEITETLEGFQTRKSLLIEMEKERVRREMRKHINCVRIRSANTESICVT